MSKLFCFILLHLIWFTQAIGGDLLPYFDRITHINGNIYCIHQDGDGYIWVGSKKGVVRYDGAGFRYYNTQDSLIPLTDNYVQAITEDKQGRLWLGTRNGLNILNRSRSEVIHLYGRNDGKSLSHSEIRKVIEDDRNKGYWIATYGGGLNFYDERSNTFRYYRYSSTDQQSLPGDNINDIMLDSKGRLWVGSEVGGAGILDEKQQHFFRPVLEDGTNSYTVSAIAEDDNGTIWIGTWTRGLYRYNENTRVLEQVYSEEGDDIPKNTIRRILPDKDGSLWLATLGGLAHYHTSSSSIQFYTYEPAKEGSLAGNAVWSIFKDREEILWVGLLTKGLCKWDMKAHRFQVFREDNSSPYAIPKDAINALYYSRDRKLWISTREGGLHIVDPKQRRFLDNRKFASMYGHSITEMVEDEQGNMWFTSDYGVFRYRTAADRLDAFPKSFFKVENQETGGIYTCTLGSEGDLYIGGWGTGLTILPRQLHAKAALLPEDFIHLTSFNSRLTNDVIWQVMSDENYTIWFNTKDGVFQYDEKSKEITALQGNRNSLRLFMGPEGEPMALYPLGQIWKLKKKHAPVLVKDFSGENIRLEKAFTDKKKRMWVSSASGLYIYSFNDADNVLRFDANDGLPEERAFWKHAVLDNGTIALGTEYGLVFIQEDDLYKNTFSPTVKLSEIRLFGKSLGSNYVGYQNQQNEIPELQFTYDENDLAFQFSPMAFSNTTNTVIGYKLNTENYWHKVSRFNPSADYPQLKPGNYQLLVQAFNTSGHSSDPQILLNFTIAPPWWNTIWAYIFYGLIFILLIWLAFSYSLVSIKAKSDLALESYKLAEQEKILQSKLQFFTNLSHELKTPLTLIKGPVEELMNNCKDPETVKALKTVYRNAANLNHLVEELLEFRKIESGLAKLKTESTDILRLTEDVLIAYSDLSRLKNIELIRNFTERPLVMEADKMKLSKALHNLFSNAFRFTPEGGMIQLDCVLENDTTLLIAVQDSGPGIREDLMSSLFDRFVTDNHEGRYAAGTGIGLALVKQIAELHKGTIKVLNTSKGARFELRLPYITSIQHKETKHDIQESVLPVKSQATLLLVEDNAEIQSYMASLLNRDYVILTAANGKEGIEMAKKHEPDLIVSDVMMPEMNGLELCAYLKTELALSHIPIILVTALSSEKDMLAGLTHQADEYISKPFDASVLKLKIRNILAARKAWKQQFKIQLETKAETSHITSVDEKLLNDIISFINTNLDNPELNVEMLSRSLGIHRSHLSRKLSALTDYSPIEFIRYIRLKKAMDLLQSRKLSVSEVAYQVGFNDPRYFSTSFKEQFGQSPSEFLKKTPENDHS